MPVATGLRSARNVASACSWSETARSSDCWLTLPRAYSALVRSRSRRVRTTSARACATLAAAASTAASNGSRSRTNSSAPCLTSSPSLKTRRIRKAWTRARRSTVSTATVWPTYSVRGLISARCTAATTTAGAGAVGCARVCSSPQPASAARPSKGPCRHGRRKVRYQSLCVRPCDHTGICDRQLTKTPRRPIVEPRAHFSAGRAHSDALRWEAVRRQRQTRLRQAKTPGRATSPSTAQ